jgi:Flp pilus assembly protein TadG
MRALLFTHNFRRSARQQGAAIVEFALVLPLLITLMAGIFEFGRAFWYYDALTKATRDGARLMSVVPRATIETGVTDTKAQVVNVVTNAGVPGLTNANVTVTCLTAAYATTACTNGTAPWGVRVQIVGYGMTIGQFIPFLIGAGADNSYTATLAPHTTMRYMPFGTPS